MKNDLVISARDLQRIQARIGVKDASIKKNPLSDTGLKHKSRERVSGWKNTFQAEQKRHEKERLQRLLDEETARRQRDLEEASIQFEDRMRVIARANELLKADNERTRGFTSSQMLSDVLAERDNQVRIKAHMDELESIRDVKYEQLLKHNCAEVAKRERAEELENRKSRVATALEQLEQIRELQEDRRAEMRQAEEDRLRMIHLAERYKQDAVEMKFQGKQKTIHANQETEKAQEYMDDMRERDEARLREQSRKIEEYAELKESHSQRIKQHEQELLSKQLQKREEMTSHIMPKLFPQPPTQRGVSDTTSMSLVMESAKDNEHKAILGQLAKSIADEYKRKVKSRPGKVRNVPQIKLEALEDAVWLNEDLIDAEKDDEEEQKGLHKNLAKKLESQIREKARRIDSARDCRAKHTIEQEKQSFQQHAEVVVKEYAEDGRNVVPLILALREYRNNPDG